MPADKVIKIIRESQQWRWRCPNCFSWTATTEEIMTTDKEIRCEDCGESITLVSAPVFTDDKVQMLIPAFGEA